jgi:hypothetical protein
MQLNEHGCAAQRVSGMDCRADPSIPPIRTISFFSFYSSYPLMNTIQLHGQKYDSNLMWNLA